MTKTTKTVLWITGALAGSCVLCTGGGLLLGAAGMLDDDTPAVGGSAGSAVAPSGSPGVAGGFDFTPPQGWTSPSTGHFQVEQKDGSAVLGVEVIHLPAIAGLDDPQGKLGQLWTGQIASDWQGVSGLPPLVMRRFVANGARAHFTSGVLKPKRGGIDTRVSAYLVEAGDRLEPLVVLQTYADPTGNETIADHMAPYSWDKTHAQVEQAIAGTQGSPVGAPLVSDEEVQGNWVFDSTHTLEWVNTLTGSTSMTAVAYSVRLTFDDAHHFTYKFQGASGQVGAMKVSQDSDEGDWHVEHDQLILEGKRTTKYLLAGAARTPKGQRSLYLLPEGFWSLSPGAVAMHGQLFVEE